MHTRRPYNQPVHTHTHVCERARKITRQMHFNAVNLCIHINMCVKWHTHVHTFAHVNRQYIMLLLVKLQQ